MKNMSSTTEKLYLSLLFSTFLHFFIHLSLPFYLLCLISLRFLINLSLSLPISLFLLFFIFSQFSLLFPNFITLHLSLISYFCLFLDDLRRFFSTFSKIYDSPSFCRALCTRVCAHEAMKQMLINQIIKCSKSNEDSDQDSQLAIK